MCLYILLMLLICGHGVCQTVNTKVGTFVGFMDNAAFNGTQRQVVKYIGIPYGEPTGGVNRFAKPKPKSPLREPYFANRTDLPNICPQLVGGYIKADILEGRLSEDCLYLSIYSPVNTLSPESKKHAVMIWVHGGSYLVGLSDQYPGDVLSAFNDVVIVVINYRLNVFGFFSIGDEYVPGNLGLWDQQLAIKWVHNYISHFGGDPDEVTLFGGSAGSGSVLYQAMYPENKGLFKRVIAQSGFPSSVAPSNMLHFANFAGCNQSSTSLVVSCLRSMSWKALSDKAEDPRAPARFAPVVDGEFIKRPPQETMSDIRSEEMQFYSTIDIIFGVNNLEAAMFMLPYYGKIAGVKEKDISWIALNVTHEMAIPRTAFENVILPKTVKKYFPSGAADILKSVIASKYSDWKEPNSPTQIRDKLMDLTTDLIFHVSAVKAADAHTAAVPNSRSQRNTFFYEYAFFSDMFEARPEWMKTGADHTDELLAVLGFTNGLYSKYHVSSYTPSLSDVKMSSILMKFWTKFAKSGNPNPQGYPQQWPKYTRESREYIQFTSELPSLLAEKKHFGEPRVSFWLETIPAVINGANLVNASADDTDKNVSELSDIDPTTAVNIIIALGVVSGVLFVCLLIVMIILVMTRRKSRSSIQYKTSGTKVELV